MKVLVIGLGSMGRRRIRLIWQYDSAIDIVGMDLNDERCKHAESIYSITTYQDVSQALEGEHPDCCFISTSPLSHAVIINQCLKAGCHVFTELNLVTDGYAENIALAKDLGVVLFLSSTQLYREEMQYIRQKIHGSEENCNYIYHVGQYLPDWHPWEDYHNYFVGQARTNACREIMAIEMPWLIDTFGKVVKIYNRKSRVSKLDIEYNDNYAIILEHESGHRGGVFVDILCRVPSRFLEIFSENSYIRWLGTPESLYEYQNKNKKFEQVMLYERIDSLSDYNETIIENDYLSEVEEFFETVKGKATPRYSFEKDYEILKLIDRIELED